MSVAVHAVVGFVIVAAVTLIFLSFGSLSFEAASLIQISVCLSVLLLIFLRAASKRNERTGLLFPFLFGFLLWLLIQAVCQKLRLPLFPEPGPWRYRVDFFVMFFTGFGIYFVISETLRNRKLVLFFTQFYVAVSTLLALYFMVFMFITPKLLENFSGSFPLLEPLRPWIGIGLQPNNLVDLFLPGAFFALSLVFYWNTRDPERERPQQMFSLILLNLCFTCVISGAVLFTKSRAGIIAFSTGLFVYFLLFTLAHERRNRALKRLVMILIVLGVFLCTLGMKDIIQEMQTVFATFREESELKGARSLTMGASWQLIKSQGLWGAGLGNFHFAWMAYHRPPFNLFPERSYNDLLWMWAETGIPGILLFWGGLLYFAVRSVMTALKTQSYFVAYLFLGSLASLLALVLHALLDPTFYVTPLNWTLFIVLALGAAALRMDWIKEKRNEFPNLLRSFSFLILFLIAFGVGWLTVNRVVAFAAVQKNSEVLNLKRAARLDPLNPGYPEDLARFYESEYEKNSSLENLEKSIDAVDRAILLDPLRLINYVRRARLLLKVEDEVGVRETFAIMRKKLPNFYPGELIASAFYMNASAETQDPRRAGRLEGLAIQHYLKAFELYPEFDKERFLAGYCSEKALARYQELRQGKQI